MLQDLQRESNNTWAFTLWQVSCKHSARTGHGFPQIPYCLSMDMPSQISNSHVSNLTTHALNQIPRLPLCFILYIGYLICSICEDFEEGILFLIILSLWVRKPRPKGFKWFYQDHSFRKSQSQPSNRSTASFSLTHSRESIAPPWSPAGLCKCLCHCDALQ